MDKLSLSKSITLLDENQRAFRPDLENSVGAQEFEKEETEFFKSIETTEHAAHLKTGKGSV